MDKKITGKVKVSIVKSSYKYSRDSDKLSVTRVRSGVGLLKDMINLIVGPQLVTGQSVGRGVKVDG